VGYEEIDRLLVDDRVYGRGRTMNGYAIVVRYVVVRYDVERRLESASSVTSGEDIDRPPAADQPSYDGMNCTVRFARRRNTLLAICSARVLSGRGRTCILEQYGLTDDRPDFAVSTKGVANVGRCRRFAVRYLH
jgi:hypothetical protein